MMAEPTTVRILYQENGVTLATAKQGLVLILGDDQATAVTVPFRWDDVLNVLPTVRGQVHWNDEAMVSELRKELDQWGQSQT